MAPLHGLRVIDLSRFLSGPFATQLLADYGADVISVESPRGRELQGPGARDSYFFLSANRGKRSLALDLKAPAGRAVLARLLATADVLVENFRPGVLGALGFEPSALLARHSKLIVCSISGFGADGPYAGRPGFDPIAQGMSGLMSLTGSEESGPTRVGIAISDLLAGIFAAQGIQLALLARTQTGRGQLVDTSLLEATIGASRGAACTESGRAGPPATTPQWRRRLPGARWLPVVAAANDATDRLALASAQRLGSTRAADVTARMKNRPALIRRLTPCCDGGRRKQAKRRRGPAAPCSASPRSSATRRCSRARCSCACRIPSVRASSPRVCR
jgi:crotonobetainyl-CoA:carnitine CoA-transferase CaiB-like acyl-CoA transferase